MTGRIVIAGAGVAGATAAKTLRGEGYCGEIVLLGAEASLPYRRPMVSKELLAGTVTEQRALLEPADFWRAQQIDVRTGSGVVRIDPDRRAVWLADGTEFGYDSLLLATGARPRALPGMAGPAGVTAGVHTLRERADIAAIRAALDADGSLLVVGAGLIGCEVAATARGLGARVTVLHAGATPLDRVAPAVIGECYRDLHGEHGVELHTGVCLSRLERTADGVAAVAANGRRWVAGAVLVAIGAVPNTELAAAAGLDIADGILVDERYRTSAPGVFAAGDAAARFDPESGVHRREEQWNSARSQGAAAARSMLGIASGEADVPWGWSTQYGLNLQFAGRIAPDDELVVRGSPGSRSLTVLALREGRPTGAVALGRPADIRAAQALIARRIPLDPASGADESIPIARLADFAGQRGPGGA
ncbi:NAD(P)/FAD-dependent oxidoreductase [Nocardia sp. IFM 10818]